MRTTGKRSTTKRTAVPAGAFIDSDGILPRVESYLRADQPFILLGNAGIGKTTLLKEIVGDKLVTAIGSELSPSDLLGRYMLIDGETKWIDGILVSAMLHGKVFYLDELPALANSPAVITVLHSILDDRREAFLVPCGRTVKAHPDFRFVASANYSASGTDLLSREFRDRFLYVPMRRLTTELEIQLLVGRHTLDEDIAEWLVRYAEVTRNVDPENGASTRQLINAGKAVIHGVDPDHAAFESMVMPIAGCSRSALQTLVQALRAENFSEIPAWQIALGSQRSAVVEYKNGETWV